MWLQSEACPLGAGGMPISSNSPRSLLSDVISRSPCNTLIPTCVWLSIAVENTWLFLEGIVVFLLINLVKMLPSERANFWGTLAINYTSSTSKILQRLVNPVLMRTHYLSVFLQTFLLNFWAKWFTILSTKSSTLRWTYHAIAFASNISPSLYTVYLSCRQG